MKVLFVCRSNAGRSTMACAFFRKFAKTYSAIDAGTQVREVNKENLPPSKETIQVMADDGIDVSKYRRKQLTPEMAAEADRIVVIMTRLEKELFLPDYVKRSEKAIYWNVTDMTHDAPYDFFISRRNKIKSLTKRFAAELDGHESK